MNYAIRFVGMVFLTVGVILGILTLYGQNNTPQSLKLSQGHFQIPTPLPSPSVTPLPSVSPSPSPLTFAQMNALYGPCAYVPTLFWHHIENMDQAKAENHAQLTVATDVFQKQMQYLHDKGYSVIPMASLINFFDTGAGLPSKPILLTFDDGYSDFISDALSILKQFGYPATLFLPTGLAENPGYVSWSSLNDANSNKILIANHTWSHKSVATDQATIEKEITTADKQLADHGFNSPKVFAYPYGNSNQFAVSVLAKNNYLLGFTTNPGSTQCKQLRLQLPRVRIGNSNLNVYGF